MSIESLMPSNPLIFCHPLLFPPSIFPSIRVFPWVSSSHQVAKLWEFQLQHQCFQWIFRTDFPTACHMTKIFFPAFFESHVFFFWHWVMYSLDRVFKWHQLSNGSAKRRQISLISIWSTFFPYWLLQKISSSFTAHYWKCQGNFQQNLFPMWL